MNKQLYIADTKHQYSFNDMIEKIEQVDNKNYIW